ncbi:MAG TPA: hypothetical protein VHO24_17715 [Opitutaceae bacterium]|nr:hypothetical protein [Opitutaceae bacterium]
MKKQKHSCINANYPETSMKVIVCYDGEVVMQTHKVSKRLSLVSLSVKGADHQIFNDYQLEVTVLQGKAVVQVKGGKKVTYNGAGSFVVPANAWVKITGLPFAQFFAKQFITAELGDEDDGDCGLR